MTEIDPAAARRAREAVPSIPCDAEGPVFREPWEAQAFALTLSLYDRRLFQWPEWAAILGDEIKKVFQMDLDVPELPFPRIKHAEETHTPGGQETDGCSRMEPPG